MTRALVVALCAALVAGACSSKEKEPEGVQPVTALPSMCEGVGALPADGEVTFVRGDLLFGTGPDGGEARCITGVAGINPVFWAPRGDVLVDAGFAAAEVISEAGRATISGPGKSPRFHGFSRPAGTHALYSALDGTELAEVALEGGQSTDISFLRRHDEAVYHPAGTQLAVTGENEAGAYGVWLVTNEGTGAHLVVASRDEDEFYGVAFSSDGDTLYYVDDQHTFFELRSVDLTTLEKVAFLPKAKLVQKEKLPISVTPSPYTDDLLTYRLGSCEEGFDTFVVEGSDTREIAADLADTADTQPVGWLPDDRLVVAVTDDLCNRERKLDLHVVDGGRVDLLVEDVTYAALRIALPDDSPPPVSGPVGDEAH
jgi:hypothetical protein